MAEPPRYQPARVASLVGAACLVLPSVLLAAADVSISKSGPPGVRPGETFQYTIVVTNAGPDRVADATVSDPTPAGLRFEANTGDCTTPFPCALGALASGETRTISARFTLPASYAGPDPIENTATLTSSGDTTPGNNIATVATAVTRVAGFYTLPPCRIVDTRGPNGPLGGPPLAAGASRTFAVREICGLPGNANSISFNITVTQPTSAGDLRIYPGSGIAPLTSTINYVSGQTRANNGTVPLSSDGKVSVQCDQGSGSVHFILDVNGYFAGTDAVETPAGTQVRVRLAPEVELTFDKVTLPGVSMARVVEFADNRPGAVDQDLQDFFPVGSPLRALLPSVVVPGFVQALGKGGPAGPPTFVLSLIDTTAKFDRTAEFHGFEDFRLAWDPPCVVSADPTREPRTFYAREAGKGEPALVEESGYRGPVFVDISSGCGSNKGSGWNFSLYLTGRDERPPLEVARYMLQRIDDALTDLARFVTNGTVAANLRTEEQAALAALDTNPATALSHMNAFLGLVDANPGAFDDTSRNVRGEFAGRAQSTLYMLAKAPGVPSGTVTPFPTLSNSNVYGITAGPDGNIWFAEWTTSKIGRITTSGVMTEFGIPTAASQPWGMAAGPDGNVWFTESAANKIGRITPTGVVTEFPIPTASSGPLGISAGADGNLWFAEATAGRIGRITTAGVVTEFPIPTAGGGPRVITGGPDGNLWFTETAANGNKIGRITPAGVITEFPIPSPNSAPYGIAAGSDGNVWFTESATYKVSRITPSGVITEFPMAVASGPQGIVTGPDGNLWVAERTSGKIARVSTAGAVALEYPVPLAHTPNEITKGPDGNLWYASVNGNSVARLVP